MHQSESSFLGRYRVACRETLETGGWIRGATQGQLMCCGLRWGLVLQEGQPPSIKVDRMIIVPIEFVLELAQQRMQIDRLGESRFGTPGCGNIS